MHAVCILALLVSSAAFGQSDATAAGRPANRLLLTPADVRVEQSLEGGYYLIVRARDGIGSVLLTESTEDPTIDAATYAYRNPRYHPENGDERRMLDGEFLDPEAGLYSLIDSTPVDDPVFGSAYRIFIPYVVEYGYEWSRSGAVQVLDGAYLSIRAFTKPYGDYSGGYRDNPFVMRVSQLPPPVREQSEEEIVVAGPPPQRPEVSDTPDLSARPGPGFMPDAVDEFERIAIDGGGEAVWTPGEEDLIEQIRRVLLTSTADSLDLVVALDTTQSMRNDIPYIKTQLVPMLRQIVGDHSQLRVGVLFYRDYMEEYLTHKVNFQSDLSFVQRIVDTIRIGGGRDIPEAVNEALYVAITGYDWRAQDRLVVLVGDAPPHPLPRGSITSAMVTAAAREAGVRIHTIILPHDRDAAAMETALR